ncbi:MAG TPA: polysaccharide deacetylase family protein [Candidatus Polarisedimenticolaceae bacterium]|nr:polysaccharide deacetylase family protein [Candidatus Polarisedimenticolaceae bacterium]
MSAAPLAWRPTPLLLGSVGLHAAGAACLLSAPAAWPAVLGTLVADHVALVGAGLLPRSTLLGPNLCRLPPSAGEDVVALTFDDGPDPAVTPRVLDLLDGARARATFFVVGERAASHRPLLEEIVRRGHRLGNHTWSHPAGFFFLPPRALRAQIARTQDLLAEAAGEPPLWFRAPAGIRSPILEPLLARAGLRLASWTRRAFDTVERNPDTVARRLTRGLRAGDVLLLHDGGSAAVLEALPRVLAAVAGAGLRSVPLPEPPP